ncbi:sulfur carrier protein ThiS [Paracoccus marinaquae]|uniref:Sulfur carrier protein ThiS n=1 Tax=Paracoccus marinaquae TaxID=2841926 RepID=A0ABS6AEA8_9RHOB|nr:sulfur carrier protein ThiS [Paracoccus marinaquae]MBU3028934.1 sulfur carrier protein ThiS [Paracoccus marinaquae]
MKITVNGTPHEIAALTLAEALAELGYAEARVATAVNESFVPAPARNGLALAAGDRLEILAPMQGG